MNNVFHKKVWLSRTLQIDVDPTPIQPIKRKLDKKSEKDYVKIKLCRDPTPEKSDMYKFRMALFDN